MKGKKSFTAYCDWLDIIQELTDEEAGQLMKHLFKYVNDENPEAPNSIVRLAFAPIKSTLNRDLKKYKEKIQERSRSGAMGNLKRYHPDLYQKVISDEMTFEESQNVASSRKTSHSDTKLADRDRDSDSVSVREREVIKATRAFDFLKEAAPEKLKMSFSMRYEKKINPEELEKFKESFNDKVDVEGLPFEVRPLLARLSTFSRNWIDNQGKFSKPKDQPNNPTSNIQAY